MGGRSKSGRVFHDSSAVPHSADHPLDTRVLLMHGFICARCVPEMIASGRDQVFSFFPLRIKNYLKKPPRDNTDPERDRKRIGKRKKHGARVTRILPPVC